MALWYIIVVCVAALTIAYVAYNYTRIKRMNEGTNEVSMGISAEDLITYKKIKGKSLQDATKETADLFGKIGRGNGITIR